MIHDKWIATIADRITSEVDTISQSLTQRITELGDRYDRPMPVIQKLASEYENEAQEYLILLTGKKRLPWFEGEWKTQKLGDVANFYKWKWLPKSALIDNWTYKCIHYGELFTKYHEVIENIISYTNENENVFLSKANDILMPTSDVTPNWLATASCIKEDDVILWWDVLIIRPNTNNLDWVFLSYNITNDKSQIMQLVSWTTVFHIYASDMAKFEFQCPEIEEQRAIVSLIANLDKEIKALEDKKNKYLHIKKAMMQQLLRGE